MEKREAANRGNDDVNLLALFHEKRHFCLDEFLGHFLSVTSAPAAFLFNSDLDEFSAERLNLLPCSGPGIKASNDSTKPTCLIGRYLDVPSGSQRILRTVAMALRPATPAPITRTLPGGICHGSRLLSKPVSI